MNQKNGTLKEKESSDKPLITRVLPSCLRNGSNSNNSNPVVKNTRVSFPDDERDLVTGYLEPANPWDNGPVSPEDLVSLYEESCKKHGTKPLEQVIDQLKVCYQACPDLDVSAPLDLASLEALEAILRRVRFQNLRIKSSELNDDAAVALFDMLEYYESTNTLSISCDSGLGPRSWQACSRLIKKAHSLEELDVRGTPLNEQVMMVFCKALKVGSKLTSLQLGRCGVNGRCLTVLTDALRCNTSLQALTLADNDLGPSDASQLGALLRVNNTLRFLDISNNSIQDSGLGHIVNGLMEQKGEGLEALVLWNTNLTENSGFHLATLLRSSCPLETLNIGQNQIGTQGITAMKSAMISNRLLQQLGVQAAQIDCEGISVIAEILAGNPALRRIDARSNHIGVKGLTDLKNVLQSGACVQRIDLDDSEESCQSLIEEIRELCRLNEARAMVKEELENSRSFSFSRKISLTCETLMRHQMEANNNLLAEPKRTGRLRSPEPSPTPSPASSPLPSPSRNRFRVSRVSESSSSSGSSASPSSPVSSRFRVTIVEPSTVYPENNETKGGFDFPSALTKEPVSETPLICVQTRESECGLKDKSSEVKTGAPESETAVTETEEQRKIKISVVPTKSQSSLEKLFGIFQNPGSLFSSVSLSSEKSKNAQLNEVKNYESSEKLNDKDKEIWEWDWSSPVGKKDTQATDNREERTEVTSETESPATNSNLDKKTIRKTSRDNCDGVKFFGC